MAATAEINVDINTSNLARALRIIAKHANACADELAGASLEVDDEPEAEVDIEAIKRERAERHRRLGGKTP